MKIKAWFEGVWMFIKVLFNYQESVIENELNIRQAWGLCHAICQARYDRGIPLSDITNYSAKENKE